MIERIPVTDRETWLALRKRDVTASVIGALFGCHPYETLLGLYMDKTGAGSPDIDNAVLRRGRILENAVAMAVMEERPDWKVVKATEYLRDPEKRIGATPDFYIHGDPRGLGVLQTKTVAPREFKAKWVDDRPPFWIALQNATELMLEPEAAFGCIAVLVVDPYKLECPIFEIPRHRGVEQRISDAVADFWDNVAFGTQPQPDFARDADLIAALEPEEVPGRRIDLSGDNLLPILLDERSELKARVKAADDRLAEIDAELRHKLGNAESGSLPGFNLSLKTQLRKAHFQAATTSRVLRVTDLRPKEDLNNDRPF